MAKIVRDDESCVTKTIPTASDVKVGGFFQFAAPNGYAIGPLYRRVKPTGFILNSTLLSDVMTRGDIVAINEVADTLSICAGNKPVVFREAYVMVTK